MTKYDIIKKLAEDRYVEKMLKKMIRQDIEEADMKDLPQMIYLQLLEKEDELIEGKEDEEDDENAKEVLKSLGFTLSSEKKAINSTRILGRKLS